MFSRRNLLLPIVVLGGVIALSGCTTNSAATSGATSGSTSTSGPAASAPNTSSPAATSPSSGSPSPSPSDTGTGAGGAAPDAGAARCTTGELTGALAGQSAGAGNVDVELQLTNTGTADCTLQGWPGLSLVGSGDGAQIGAAATFDRATAHPTVALKPGTAAVAELHYVQADAFDPATCKPLTGDGFRVYPPGSTTSLFVKDAGVRGCSAGAEKIFTIGALH